MQILVYFSDKIIVTCTSNFETLKMNPVSKYTGLYQCTKIWLNKIKQGKKTCAYLTNNSFPCTFWRKNQESSSLWEKSYHNSPFKQEYSFRDHDQGSILTQIKCMMRYPTQNGLSSINIFKQTLVFLIGFTLVEVPMNSYDLLLRFYLSGNCSWKNSMV